MNLDDGRQPPRAALSTTPRLSASLRSFAHLFIQNVKSLPCNQKKCAALIDNSVPETPTLASTHFSPPPWHRAHDFSQSADRAP